MNPDLINGSFEFVGGCLLWLNVRQLLRDKKLRGVSKTTTGIFLLWGVWNLFYYPHLNQWFSLIGGINIVAANATWVYLALKYRRN